MSCAYTAPSVGSLAVACSVLGLDRPLPSTVHTFRTDTWPSNCEPGSSEERNAVFDAADAYLGAVPKVVGLVAASVTDASGHPKEIPYRSFVAAVWNAALLLYPPPAATTTATFTTAADQQPSTIGTPRGGGHTPPATPRSTRTVAAKVTRVSTVAKVHGTPRGQAPATARRSGRSPSISPESRRSTFAAPTSSTGVATSSTGVAGAQRQLYRTAPWTCAAPVYIAALPSAGMTDTTLPGGAGYGVVLHVAFRTGKVDLGTQIEGAAQTHFGGAPIEANAQLTLTCSTPSAGGRLRQLFRNAQGVTSLPGVHWSPQTGLRIPSVRLRSRLNWQDIIDHSVRISRTVSDAPPDGAESNGRTQCWSYYDGGIIPAVPASVGDESGSDDEVESPPTMEEAQPAQGRLPLNRLVELFEPDGTAAPPIHAASFVTVLSRHPFAQPLAGAWMSGRATVTCAFLPRSTHPDTLASRCDLPPLHHLLAASDSRRHPTTVLDWLTASAMHPSAASGGPFRMGCDGQATVISSATFRAVAAQLTLLIGHAHARGVVIGPLVPWRVHLEPVGGSKSSVEWMHVQLEGVGTVPPSFAALRRHPAVVPFLSPAYLRQWHPERPATDAPVWQASDDWFSLGALLFWARTGRVLLDGKDASLVGRLSEAYRDGTDETERRHARGMVEAGMSPAWPDLLAATTRVAASTDVYGPQTDSWEALLHQHDGMEDVATVVEGPRTSHTQALQTVVQPLLRSAEMSFIRVLCMVDSTGGDRIDIGETSADEVDGYCPSSDVLLQLRVMKMASCDARTVLAHELFAVSRSGYEEPGDPEEITVDHVDFVRVFERKAPVPLLVSALRSVNPDRDRVRSTVARQEPSSAIDVAKEKGFVASTSSGSHGDDATDVQRTPDRRPQQPTNCSVSIDADPSPGTTPYVGVPPEHVVDARREGVQRWIGVDNDDDDDLSGFVFPTNIAEDGGGE